MNTIKTYSSALSENDYDITKLKNELKDLMWNNVGIIRTEEGLLKALEIVKNYKNNFKRNRKCLNREEYEYRNMLTVAECIIKSALSRKESRGAHSRNDYKNTANIVEHSNIIKEEKKEKVNA